MVNVKQDRPVSGLWPGVVAITGDADMLCVACARQCYGAAPVQQVIDGKPGYEQYTDHEGNTLGVVLRGSEDLHGQYCGRCHVPLCDDDCACYPHEECCVCGEIFIAIHRYIRNGVCYGCRDAMPWLWRSIETGQWLDR